MWGPVRARIVRPTRTRDCRTSVESAMKEAEYENAAVLVVDDEESNVRLLRRILGSRGYRRVRGTTRSDEALALCREEMPDLVLLDLHMPAPDGYAVLRALRSELPRTSFLPILVLTGDISPEARERALAGGASDFLNRPFDVSEVVLRCRNLLRIRFLTLELQAERDLLERRVHDRTHELEEARLELLDRLAAAGECRDDDTGQHTRRVGELSARLAAALDLPAEQVELIRRAAPLHDVGKIGIPDAILLKADRLTPQEFEVMKTHTSSGARLLAGSRSKVLQVAEQIAGAHHERWDGGGYPAGLAGERIPLAARIVTVADTFDALTNDRPYRESRSPLEALDEIRRESGKQFDPRVVDALMRLTGRESTAGASA